MSVLYAGKYGIHVCGYNWAIGIMVRTFANGPRDQVSIPCHIIPKTQKVELDAALLCTQHYKVRIMGKVEYSRE